MTKLTLDPSWQTKLADLHAQLELCDEAGRTLGYFMPVAERQRLQQLEEEHQRLLYASAQAQFTDAELDEAEQEEEEYTTEEVLKHAERS